MDNRALVWIHTLSSPSGMVERWLLTLSRFDFVVQHRLGKHIDKQRPTVRDCNNYLGNQPCYSIYQPLGILHGNADGVSRAEHLPEADGSTMMVEESISAVLPLSTPEVWSAEDWIEAQKSDEDLQPLRVALIKGEKPSALFIRGLSHTAQVYFQIYDSLHLDGQGILCYRRILDPNIPTQKKSVKMVPRVWWFDAIKKVHLHGMHCGQKNTSERASRYIWFAGMNRISEYITRNCLQCQAAQPKPKDQRHTYRPTISGFPMQRLSIDYVGPLPVSPKGNKYIFTCLCSFR